MKNKRRLLNFTIIATLIAALLSLWIYRGTGTGYVRTVSGIDIPWSRVNTEHYNCDFGQYSVFHLREDTMQSFISDNPWVSDPPTVDYNNDCLTFPSLTSVHPLPSRDELIWMNGKNKHSVWRMYLHVPTQRLLVAIEHADMAGDHPARAPENDRQ
jgi:hypothetical protein